ncbi:hypothetical protein D3C71_2038640 [compost metagenome]
MRRIGLTGFGLECAHGLQLILQIGVQGCQLFAQGGKGIEVRRVGLLGCGLELVHGVLLALQLGL